MEPKYIYEELIEKIIMARLWVKQIPKAQHNPSCVARDSYPSPCDCGADKANEPIKNALEALELK